MPKVNMASLVRRLKQAQARVANERDKLRELESDVAQIAQDCDEAHDDLERAIDALSRMQ